MFPFKKNKTSPGKSTLPVHKPHSQVLQRYLNEIGKYPLLTVEEEKQIAQKFYETKDPKFAKILARSNLRFVVKVATQYTVFGAKLIDLIQEGNMGLLQAIKEFNPYKEVRLITYAVWWIRGYIQDYLIRQYSLVRLGTTAKQRKLFYLLKKQQNEIQALPAFQHKNPYYLLPGGFKKDEVLDMKQRVTKRDLSLDEQIPDQAGKTFLDTLAAPNENNIEDQLNELQESAILKKKIEKLKPELSQKELYILKHRLLAQGTPKTLQDIGDHFLITKEAVRQAENRLIQKIKKIMLKKS